jgi:hypothetical protein
MPEQLILRGRQATITIELNDSATARQLAEKAPFDAPAQIWGDEIYFSSPVEADNDAGDAAVVAVGDVAYWPPGKAVCLFFGPTPASTDERPVAASPVTVLGRIVEGLDDCRRVGSGETLYVEPAAG